jgi:Domain of unknown function (DUF3854)
MKTTRKDVSLSQLILDDLAQSHLDAKDAADLGWYEKNGNLVMPYLNGSGLERTRFSVPLIKKKKSMRYFQPMGTSPELYLPRIGGINWDKVKNDVSIKVYCTEGEKKAAVACKVGIPCIGLSGVDCWARKGGIALPQWDEFNFVERQVVIVFDSDIIDKAPVQLAERRLAQMLISRGAKASRIRLSESLMKECISRLKDASK